MKDVFSTEPQNLLPYLSTHYLPQYSTKYQWCCNNSEYEQTFLQIQLNRIIKGDFKKMARKKYPVPNIKQNQFNTFWNSFCLQWQPLVTADKLLLALRTLLLIFWAKLQILFSLWNWWVWMLICNHVQTNWSVSSEWFYLFIFQTIVLVAPVGCFRSLPCWNPQLYIIFMVLTDVRKFLFDRYCTWLHLLYIKLCEVFLYNLIKKKRKQFHTITLLSICFTVEIVFSGLNFLLFWI